MRDEDNIDNGPLKDIRKEYTRKTKFRKVRTEKQIRLEKPLREWIDKCKEKMDKEDKPFLSMKDYYDIMIKLGYRKENE